MTGLRRNIPLFIAFRVLFNARFYYPVLGVLFIDLGLGLAEYAMLNAMWAVCIIFLEIPSGALADAIGRRWMVVLAAVLMVAEMVVFAFAPAGGGALLFWLLALNRILSGAAEACASGADEALAFDSLPVRSRESMWPRVLASLMRWQSAGFFVAMLAGAALFDREWMVGVLAAVGISVPVGETTRWPVFATLGTACLCLVVALLMREPRPSNNLPRSGTTIAAAWRNILSGLHFVLSQRPVLLLLAAALACDSFVRLFLTYASNYNRLIGLPEAAFGLVSSAMALLGFVAAPIGRQMVGRAKAATNLSLIAGLIFCGLTATALAIPLWGALAVIPLGLSMSLLGFCVSHYLNVWTPSDFRATVLSFRGVALNLGYGTIGLLFAALTTTLRATHPDASTDSLFGQSLLWLPPAFAIVALTLALFAKKSAPQAHGGH
jgi:MFS family permease